MWRYRPTYSSEELYHHGILGQKWGEKKGPPYPLASSDHSAAEQKAGWRKSLDSSGNSGSLSDKQKKSVSKKYEKLNKKSAKEELKNAGKINLEAYNRTADEINSHKAYEYRQEATKKYGEDYGHNEEAIKAWNDMVNDTYKEKHDEVVQEFYSNNKKVQKTLDFAKQYDMASWNDLAKQTSDTMDALNKRVEERKKKK